MMLRLAVLLLSATVPVDGFSSALFQEAPALKKTAPSVHEGVDVELPDFDELFDRIQQVSPLARQVMSRPVTGQLGFEHVDDNCKLLFGELRGSIVCFLCLAILTLFANLES